jgi:DNA-directed RNA polymerase specialized sigma24 family protein
VPTPSIDPTSAILRHEREIARVAGACAEVIDLHGFDKDAFVADAMSRVWLAFYHYDGQIPADKYINMVIRSALCDKLRSIERNPERSGKCQELSYEVDYAAQVDCVELMGRLTPGQRTRLREIADGSEIEPGAGASRQRYIRVENSKLLASAKEVYNDYRPAGAEDQERESHV